MKQLGRWMYSEKYDPPAPIVDVTINSPKRIKISALIDSGADITVISKEKADESSLISKPPVSVVFIKSPDYVGLAPIFLLEIEIGDEKFSIATAVAMIKEEGILGRDLLNKLVVELNGPEKVASIKLAGY
ncbi:MAG: retroviral-like aspartic protease family protein [Nitrososphaerales archaeon]